jgi:hypothetical protein
VQFSESPAGHISELLISMFSLHPFGWSQSCFRFSAAYIGFAFVKNIPSNFSPRNYIWKENINHFQVIKCDNFTAGFIAGKNLRISVSVILESSP